MGCHFEMRKKSPQPFWEVGCRGDLARGGGLGRGSGRERVSYIHFVQPVICGGIICGVCPIDRSLRVEIRVYRSGDGCSRWQHVHDMTDMTHCAFHF